MQLYALLKLMIVGVALVGVAVKGIAAAQNRAQLRARMREGNLILADNTVVTLTGTVRLIGDPLHAPLSGRPCVFHRSTARVRVAKAGPLPHQIESQSRSAMIQFVLQTRDGEVIVDGSDADVPMRPTPIVPRQLERETAFLREVEMPYLARQANFDEIVIEPGATISVYGIARVEVASAGSGELGYREAPTIVRLVGDDRHPLTLDER